jgi:hypothetical protein
MPTLNTFVLIDCIRKLTNRLYNIYVDTTHLGIADALLHEINYLDNLVSELSKVTT